ncbi:uncharacterized protein LOC119325460 isoform X2 [Triticum dicoccoides]|uniref:uncharacterized protein LOC119325460 isoform X2 n=1 Tax=Triticum dicoccoides TaxID=85692 RepID=UPI001891E4F7|nr:uncharacterized protein LOC119325460 isoform X2 [Triticum dicoccoides]
MATATDRLLRRRRGEAGQVLQRMEDAGAEHDSSRLRCCPRAPACSPPSAPESCCPRAPRLRPRRSAAVRARLTSARVLPRPNRAGRPPLPAARATMKPSRPELEFDAIN